MPAACDFKFAAEHDGCPAGMVRGASGAPGLLHRWSDAVDAGMEPYTRLGALVGGIPNTGTLLHQGALPIGMRTELAKTLHLEAPAPPRQAPAKPDTETPASEEAETAADAAEGEPES